MMGINILFRVLDSGNLLCNNARAYIINTFDVGLFDSLS
jgi:hypothetical protein